MVMASDKSADIFKLICTALYPDKNESKAIGILKSNWDIIDPNYMDYHYYDSKCGILHCASMEDNCEFIDLVLSHPMTDPNIINSSGGSPISCSQSLEALKCFLKHPLTDVNIDCDVPNILHRISERFDILSLKWIIAYGKIFNPKKRVIFNEYYSDKIHGDNYCGSMIDWVGYCPSNDRVSKAQKDFYNLLIRYSANPTAIRLRIQLEICPELPSTDLFALVVFHSDDFLKRKEENERFFKIAKKLPMELQMILCCGVYGSRKTNIPSKDFEVSAKKLIVQLNSTPNKNFIFWSLFSYFFHNIGKKLNFSS